MDKQEFIFTIARMNPPTTGHNDLINQMVNRALADGVDKVHIILSHTIDEKNPLPCNKKREIVKELVKDVNGVQVIIVCMDDPTDAERCGSHPIMKSICHAISHATSDDQYTKAILFVGEDRASSYGWIQTAFSNNNPPMELEIVPLERTTNPISATKIRAFVKEGDYSGFISAYQGSGLGQATLDDMYSSIQSKTYTKKRKLVGGKKSRASAKYSNSNRGGKAKGQAKRQGKAKRTNSSDKRNK